MILNFIRCFNGKKHRFSFNDARFYIKNLSYLLVLGCRAVARVRGVIRILFFASGLLVLKHFRWPSWKIISDGHSGLKCNSCDQSVFTCSRSRIEGSSTTIVFIPQLRGRLGNYFTAFRKAIVIAIVQGCHLELPPELKVLPGFRSNCATLLNTLAGPSSVCKNGTGDYFFQQRIPIAFEKDQLMAAQVRSALRLYTGTNHTHAYNIRCPGSIFVAAHVRSGDVTAGHYDPTDGSFKRDFALSWSKSLRERMPFPTAYYSHVIGNLVRSAGTLSDKKIYILSQDQTNPTVTFFNILKDWVRPHMYVRTGAELIDDVVTLTCSEHAVLSRGTFAEAFHLREEQILHSLVGVHLPCVNTHGTKRTYQLINATEYHSVLSSGWRNTPYHRDILTLPYMIRSC